jgi:hypothetical protein
MTPAAKSRLFFASFTEAIVFALARLRGLFGVVANSDGTPVSAARALANLEQVRVCSRADQVQVVAVDFVEQEPIRFDVAVPMGVFD